MKQDYTRSKMLYSVYVAAVNSIEDVVHRSARRQKMAMVKMVMATLLSIFLLSCHCPKTKQMDCAAPLDLDASFGIPERRIPSDI